MTDLLVASDLDRQWWKEAVVYQIYPRSFNDADGDGTGDLPGITQRLDHLASLGVDVVWLSPVYDSPMADNGYDIRNYRTIADVFGTMEDFDAMLAGLHERGIRLIMDLVVNHTSDEHRWFEAARSSRDNPYRDYYVWKDPAPDGGPPTNWPSFFGGPAWSFDEATGQYYLHLFDAKQPDLNWENPDVRADVYAMMRFWLEKGVDGFRMDVITFLSKDLTFPDLPEGFEGGPFRFYANGPRIHDFLREMNDRVLSDFDVMTVGEGWGIRPDEALRYVGRDRKELQTFFHFDHVQITRDPDDFYGGRDWTLPELKAIFATWDETFAGDGWVSLFFGNHDMPRMVSIYGSDAPAHRRNASKLLHTFLMTMRGTPYVYQGDELGLPNPAFDDWDEYRDVSTLGDVREKRAAGADMEAVLRDHQMRSRDNARTPMPWTGGPAGGFTAGTPWIPVHPDADTLHVDAAEADPDSVLHYLRRLIALRHDHDVLVYGAYTDCAPADEQVWAYERRLGDAVVLVLLNWSDAAARVDVPGTHRGAATLWIGTHADAGDATLGDAVTLDPWEARVYAVSLDSGPGAGRQDAS